jgi:O-antigen/teichoic acid export membrane protein
MARSLVKDSVIYGVGNMLTRALGLLLIPIYTRFLDVSEYGALALLNLVLQQTSWICLLGVSTAAMRHYFDPGADEAHRQRVYGTATTLLVAFPAAVLVGLAPVVWYLATRFVPSVPFLPFVLVILLTGLFTPLTKLLQGLLRVRRRAMQFTAFNLAFFAFQTIAIYVALATLGGGLAGQLYAQLLSQALFAIASFALLAAYARPRLDRPMARELLAYGLPLVPFFILLWVYDSAGRFMLEHYGDLGRVGIFALAAQFAGLISLAATALDNVMLPSFLETAHQDGGDRRLGELVCKYIVWLGLLGLVVLVVASPAIRIFGTEPYFEAEHHVAPLVLALWIAVWRTPVTWSLNFSKRSTALSLLNAAGVVTLVALLVVFLGRLGLGIDGVAWSLALAGILNVVLGYAVAQRHFRLRFPVVRFGRAVVVMLAGGGTIAWLGPAGLDWTVLAAEAAVLAVTALAAMRLAGLGNPLLALRRG